MERAGLRWDPSRLEGRAGGPEQLPLIGVVRPAPGRHAVSRAAPARRWRLYDNVVGPSLS
jgi:hypothetical protein